LPHSCEEGGRPDDEPKPDAGEPEIFSERAEDQQPPTFRDLVGDGKRGVGVCKGLVDNQPALAAPSRDQIVQFLPASQAAIGVVGIGKDERRAIRIGKSRIGDRLALASTAP